MYCWQNEFNLFTQKKWNAFVTLSTGINVVGYNATIQGGLLSESTYTISEIKNLVGSANIGLTILYNNFVMEYIQHFNTPGFPNAEYHSWGYLLLKYKFN